MAKSVTSLTGAGKNTYLRQALEAAAEGGTDASGAPLSQEFVRRAVQRLEQEITRVWVRNPALGHQESAAQPSDSARTPSDVSTATLERDTATPAAIPSPTTPVFDPYSPNVIVVLRNLGRAEVLAALGTIAAPDDLRCLAREQQLGIPQELATTDEIRLAIVAAAERQIANRRAAGS